MHWPRTGLMNLGVPFFRFRNAMNSTLRDFRGTVEKRFPSEPLQDVFQTDQNTPCDLQDRRAASLMSPVSSTRIRFWNFQRAQPEPDPRSPRIRTVAA